MKLFGSLKIFKNQLFSLFFKISIDVGLLAQELPTRVYVFGPLLSQFSGSMLLIFILKQSITIKDLKQIIFYFILSTHRLVTTKTIMHIISFLPRGVPLGPLIMNLAIEGFINVARFILILKCIIWNQAKGSWVSKSGPSVAPV